MRYILLSMLVVCAATLVVTAGCSDTTEPPGPGVTDAEVLASKPDAPPGKDKKPPKDEPGDPSNGELCWYISSPKTGAVAWEDGFIVHRFEEGEGRYGGYVFKIPLDLWDDDDWTGGKLVGGGYMISAVERDGHRYNMYHEVFIQPDSEHAWNQSACSTGDCTGTVLARDWVRCRNLPCDVKTLGVDFVPGTGEGVLADFSGNINNNGTLYQHEDAGSYWVHTWPHGRICVPLPLGS